MACVIVVLAGQQVQPIRPAAETSWVYVGHVETAGKLREALSGAKPPTYETLKSLGLIESKVGELDVFPDSNFLDIAGFENRLAVLGMAIGWVKGDKPLRDFKSLPSHERAALVQFIDRSSIRSLVGPVAHRESATFYLQQASYVDIVTPNGPLTIKMEGASGISYDDMNQLAGHAITPDEQKSYDELFPAQKSVPNTSRYVVEFYGKHMPSNARSKAIGKIIEHFQLIVDKQVEDALSLEAGMKAALGGVMSAGEAAKAHSNALERMANESPHLFGVKTAAEAQAVLAASKISGSNRGVFLGMGKQGSGDKAGRIAFVSLSKLRRN